MEKKKRFNCLSVTAQMEKFNITENEATEKIRLIRKSYGTGNPARYQTYMKKYNMTEEESKLQVEKFKEKMKSSFSKRSAIEIKEMSPKNKEHWIKKGYSKDEAIKLAADQIFHMQEAFRKKKKLTDLI